MNIQWIVNIHWSLIDTPIDGKKPESLKYQGQPGHQKRYPKFEENLLENPFGKWWFLMGFDGI